MNSRRYFLSLLLWMALIWILSSIPAREIPQIKIFGFDKLAHFGVYFVWGGIGRLYIKSCNRNRAESMFLLSIMLLLAALDEFHQNYIPGRSVSGYDLMANWSGTLVGWWIFGSLTRRRQK